LYKLFVSNFIYGLDRPTIPRGKSMEGSNLFIVDLRKIDFKNVR
jgi:hypothetical protein